MTTFLAILTLATQAALLTLLGTRVLALTGRVSPYARITAVLRADALRLAALFALTATAGSLYLSEVRHFPPCELCWFQRIAMYPLAVVLPIAAWRRDRDVWRYAVPLALLGGAVSIYHYQLERFPDQASIACSVEVPCTAVWFIHFGYITIPLMALTAFAAIATLLTIGRRHG